MTRYPARYIFLSMFLLLSCLASGQEEIENTPETELQLGNLFVEDSPLPLTLQFDMKKLQATRKKGDYHDALLLTGEGDILSEGWPVRIKTRGIFRRQHCSVPPLWINVKNSGMETVGLAGVSKIKLVARCRNTKSYKNYVLKEYLVYKMYELLTPYSFRTRLVRLTYVDSSRDMEVYECWAYLIEPMEKMTRRLNARQVKNDELSMRRVQPHAMDRLAMFQFMIGNTDYSITGLHNVKILGLDKPGTLGIVPVPYDFDFTGLVNTIYAHPREGIGIDDVRQRYYEGPCRSEALHMQVVEEFRVLEELWMELIMTFEYLDEEVRIEMVEYLESFFSESAREQFVQRRIQPTCKD